ncbi:MAG: cell division protein ZapA [Myxococcota bacterium]
MQVTITIRGRQFTVRGNDGGGDIQRLADEVNARMDEVANHTRSFDEYTIAMLTALNLASELQQLRKQVAGQLDDFDRDLASMSAILDAFIPEDIDEGSAEDSAEDIADDDTDPPV